jgi:hypothetical protein
MSSFALQVNDYLPLRKIDRRRPYERIILLGERPEDEQLQQDIAPPMTCNMRSPRPADRKSKGDISVHLTKSTVVGKSR